MLTRRIFSEFFFQRREERLLRLAFLANDMTGLVKFPSMVAIGKESVAGGRPVFRGLH